VVAAGCAAVAVVGLAAAYAAGLAAARRDAEAEARKATATLSDLGWAELRLGDLPAARLRLSEALSRRQAASRPDPALDGEVMARLGEVLWRTGELDRAEALHRRALAVRRRALPAGDSRIGESLAALGALLAERGDCAGALPLLDEGAAILAGEPGAERGPAAAAGEALRRCRLSAPAPP
jgi:tetratricopeptide (TPR) repeat protein